VCAALRAKRVLLVLDNAEHLDGLAALSRELVQACPQLKVLLTSRARLGIAGEWLMPLAGLPVPDPDETEPDALRAFDAIRLFELRAQAASTSFAATDAVAEVAQLVRLLEGTPLAIELAAAWVRLLPVAEIRREI
jgi:predicted ATPase